MSQAISVKIAGKSYPMTVEDDREEETIRKAERLIRERMRTYEESFAVRDVRDLLGMCALHFAAEAVDAEGRALEQQQQVHDRIGRMNAALEAALGQA